MGTKAAVVEYRCDRCDHRLHRRVAEYVSRTNFNINIDSSMLAIVLYFVKISVEKFCNCVADQDLQQI